MAGSKSTANPINPRGIRRGPAKPDVYRILRRLDEKGLHELEREELEQRLGWELPTGKRPSGQVIAQVLLLEVDFRDWLVEEPDERERRIIAGRDSGSITDEESDALLREAWKEERHDRCRWAALLLATRRWPSEDEVRLLQSIDAGHDVELPDELGREADKLLKRERKRRRGELPGKWARLPFRPQLGTLPEQSPRQRELTIADWRRNVRRASSKGSQGGFPL